MTEWKHLTMMALAMPPDGLTSWRAGGLLRFVIHLPCTRSAREAAGCLERFPECEAHRDLGRVCVNERLTFAELLPEPVLGRC